MAWSPDKEFVLKNEVIGRRIFEDKIWSDEVQQAQPHRLRYDHFLDTRYAEDLSVDRLGASGNPDTRVCKKLLEIVADEHDKPFAAWATTLRKHIHGPGEAVIAVAPSAKPNNPYHADISREGYRDKITAYFFALHLREIFEGTGKLHEQSSSKPR